ncbi:MAG: hypothetical protein WCK83_16745, partial [Burkholderiales bacterium]
ALLAHRLSLNGVVFVGGQVIAPTVPGIGRPIYLRYWPQIYPFHLDASHPSEPLVLQIGVQGHVSMKNGLGELSIADDVTAHKSFVTELVFDVFTVLAMAAAIAMAGVLGIAASGRDRPSEKLLFMVSGLSILAAIRMTVIFVTDPPMPLGYWSAFTLGLFVLISVWIVAILTTYLRPGSNLIWPTTATTGLLVLITLMSLPPNLIQPVVNAGLLLLSLLGLVLLGMVFLQVKRKSDSTGWQLLLSFVLVIAFLVRDLFVHLGEETISRNYLLLRTIPVLVIILIVLLMRSIRSQRALEQALQAATDRKDDLLRDLHDGIGSRLVALSFSVRTLGADKSVVSEIDGLIQELQVIQKTVRSGDTTLQSLLSDVRHLFAQIGGGTLPLQWELAPSLPDYPLTADQAIATVRILEEAVANAMKHAEPGTIWIKLAPVARTWTAILSVSDDGKGQFQPSTSGGLRNIEWRARRAGLGVQFTEGDGVKSVKLMFPAPRAQRWLLAALMARLRALRHDPASG